MKKHQAAQKEESYALGNMNELIAFLDNHADTYDAGYHEITLNRMRNNYARLYAQYQAIQQAHEEGVFEVTIKSATQTITLHTSQQVGFDASQELEQDLTNQLHRLTKNILHMMKDQVMTRESTLYGENSGREDHPETVIIHALCMPTPRPTGRAPQLVEGDRCPFLPADTAPVRQAVTA